MNSQDFHYGGTLPSFNTDGIVTILLILLAGFAFVCFVAWLTTLYPRYYMIKSAELGMPWTAFIPVVQDVQMFRVAGFPWWAYFVCLLTFAILGIIPIIKIFAILGLFVLIGILRWKIAENFGLGICGKILSVIFGFLAYWYIALTKKQHNNAIDRLQRYKVKTDDWYKTSQQYEDNYQHHAKNWETNYDNNNK